MTTRRNQIHAMCYLWQRPIVLEDLMARQLALALVVALALPTLAATARAANEQLTIKFVPT